VLAAIVLFLLVWNGIRLVDGRLKASELVCLDPTDECNWSTYRVLNDTNQPVVVGDCAYHCGRDDHVGDSFRILPDQRTVGLVVV
jgi:hypothetical protein